VALPQLAYADVEKQPKSLRIFTTTYNMARTPIDFSCAALLPKPLDYDLIAIGLQEASMGEQKKYLLKIMNYLERFDFQNVCA